MKRILLFVVYLLALALPPSRTRADDTTAHFEKHVRPVLVSTCIKCHGPDKQEGELRLDSLAAMLKGGESGPAIVPGKPEESLLLSALRYDELEMPPNKQLAAKEIARIASWIQADARWPQNAEQIRQATEEITEQDRSWWAFQPLTVSSPPTESFPGRAHNEIDQFIHHRLSEAGMEPAAKANKASLLRRLHQDLIGLPPSPEELDAFLADDSKDAYEQLVDNLLADQRYGEHWARFWLDLVRYAESDGWKADAYRPHIWRYRDYVVDAFNHDKPYPEFVREQLAGDELPDPSPEALAATGYLRLGIYEYNQRNARQHWDDILNEITDVTGDVFLGIGMACARCHDHKFDPVLQVDYFKLRAFFEPIVFTDDVQYATTDQIAQYNAAHHNWLDQSKAVRHRIDALLQPYHDKKWLATVDKFPIEIQASYHKPTTERNSWDQQMAYFIGRQFYEEGGGPLKSMKDGDKQDHEALQQELEKFASVKPKELPTLMSAENYHGTFAPTVIPDREDLGPIEPGLLRVMSEVCGPEFPECDRQRRTTLADWITSPDNPLTTRLIVNRIWKQHFGRGLVSSTSDFGTLGGQPSHPDLLDWLTRTFIDDGWSLKRLHKKILMSSTWQQATKHRYAAEYARLDPDNRLWWRRDVQRLSAEQIRDAMLFASGELELALGGPSVTGTSARRSLYVKSFRNNPDRLLQAFDVANGLKSVAQRSSTTTPIQALMMINGDFTLKRAEAMAQRVSQLPDNDHRVQRAMALAWCRAPTAEELVKATQFLESVSTQDEVEQLTDFCHVLLNSNEFLYVD